MEERLIACGVSADTAREVVEQYGSAKDELEKYVKLMEFFYNDRREYV